MFTCIYCQRCDPAVRPSRAHIFPDALGGITFSEDIVCEGCNREISRAFEEIEIRKFAFFRSIRGIRNLAFLRSVDTEGGRMNKETE
jgi:hypothetical protein